jgi:predicted HicB family RNase H-like nuclease
MVEGMNDTLTYKGFTGSVHFSADDGVFFGKVEGTDDLITFEGKTVNDLTCAFYYMVEEHIKDCQKENMPPEKSYGRKSRSLFRNEALDNAVL